MIKTEDTPAFTFFKELVCQTSDAEISNMFGKPCIKTNGKAFACFFNECMVFKLNCDDKQSALALDEALLFDPSGKGRPMKEWVQVPYKHKDLWSELTLKAHQYVRSAK